MKNVLVIFGGRSVEHDISIITGLGALNNTSGLYNVIGVYIDKNGQWWTGRRLREVGTFQPFDKTKLCKCTLMPSKNYLIEYHRFSCKNIPIYCAINCLHGHNGEDGAIAGLLQLCNIPHTSASVLSSAVCMDKTMTKQLLSHNKIKTVDYVMFDKREYQNNKATLLSKIQKKLGYPCIVKPNSLGSSIGVNVAINEQDCEEYIQTCFSFDDRVLIEKYLTQNRELNIAVMQDKDKITTSNIEEVCLDNHVFNFNDKYQDKSTKRQVPADIAQDLEEQIVKTATNAYKILRCSGVVRIDFLYSDNTLYLNEVNTIPGSLGCYLWKDPKITYKTLLDKLIQNAISKQQKCLDKKYSFDSNVLNNLTQDNFILSK